MAEQKNIKLAFYGDDFTGSTDALESLSFAGLRTILFLGNPTPEQINRFGHPDAIGVAGMTRAMVPVDMRKTLENAFTELKKLNPCYVHYKVCSTFDSSPEIGNIGTAIETGQQIFQNQLTPVLVAAPHLGRYSVFGNLFARLGIGSSGKIFRLDRHPSMCAHPVTPASESDLGVHLSRQTKLPIDLINLIELEKSTKEIQQLVRQKQKDGKRIIFFDGMYETQMARIGEVIDSLAGESGTVFTVGSSGVEKALGDFWTQRQLFIPKTNWGELVESNPLLVLSGSVSPVTGDQINWAVDRGFEEIEVETQAIMEDDPETFILKYQQQICMALERGRSVILHTSKGPDDKRISEIKKIQTEKSWDEQTARVEIARRFGKILGQTAKRALKQVSVKRLVIAGGDTSGYVARELGIEAVEMLAPIFPGAPLCRAFAKGSPVDGMEVNLKGGQVGDESYFVRIKNGKL